MKSLNNELINNVCHFVLITGLIFISLLFIHPKLVSAQPGGTFDPARIIDDAVFFNPNSLSSQQIQDFLNTKVPTCDTNGTQPITPGSTTTRAQYSIQNGKPAPPYVCLKDYTDTASPSMPTDAYCGQIIGGSKSAATIIKEVSAACGINPQVMLILLQKEQTLITDDWPYPSQYTKATGYGCPDTASCSPEFSGFFNQIYYAARQFQRYIKQPDLFNYRVGQTSFVAYQANSTSCGGTNITIQNQATAALYNYTPYQPNAAALANLYGLGDACSAYGNRNFWRLFWDWFGNPIGSEYAWLIDNYTYAGGDTNIAQGETETVTLRARNVGRQPWMNTGSCPARLGTWDSGRNSSFADPSWISPTKIVTMQEAIVRPNEVGTFTFKMTPSSKGTFIEGMNVVLENCQWLQWPGFSPTIRVTGQYDWQIVDTTYGMGTGYMEPGSTQLITLRALNTGSATWSKTSGPPIRVGTWQPDRQSKVGSGWLGTTRAVTMNENTVAPGQIGGFQFYVTMPASGQFYERLNLVAEGVAWFNDTGLTLYLQGKTFAWQPVWYSPSTGNWNIARNTQFTITLKAKNTGTATWTKASSSPIRLGTNPPGRGTALEDPSWINSIRPAGLIENTVAPGQEGTFSFLTHTPSTPGVRNEQFNLVSDGMLWFQDPGFGIRINVL